MPKKPRVSTLLDSQHVKPSETIPEMHKKIHKMFFDFEIIAFELVALNTRFYCKRILVIGSQYVNKQSQDFRYF